MLHKFIYFMFDNEKTIVDTSGLKTVQQLFQNHSFHISTIKLQYTLLFPFEHALFEHIITIQDFSRSILYWQCWSYNNRKHIIHLQIYLVTITA